MISDLAPCKLCGGVLRHHVSCVRFRHDDHDETISHRVNTSFHIGETLLLRDAVLKRFDALVELRAIDRDVALVRVRDQLLIVSITSLRRVAT